MDIIEDNSPATYTKAGVKRILATTCVHGEGIQHYLSFLVVTDLLDLEYFLSDPALSTVNIDRERDTFLTTGKLISATASDKPLRNHAFCAISLIGDLTPMEAMHGIGTAVTAVVGGFNAARGAAADLSNFEFCRALQTAQGVLLNDYLDQKGMILDHAPQGTEIGKRGAWRELAVKWDLQRMSLRWHLQALVNDPVNHLEAAKKFLTEAP